LNRTIAARATLGCACLLATMTRAAPIPVEAYGQVEAVSQVTINPAGTQLAWAGNDGSNTQVIVFEIATRKTLRTFKVEPGQDDLTDGVKALITQGIADPKRVCIVGASYGGYAALAGAALTPELYACAASVAGVADLPELLAWGEKLSGDESD